MTSRDRMFAVLQLFSSDKPFWSINEATEALNQSRSTVYRYFRSLSEAGLTVPTARGDYALGPLIMKLDLQMRLTDPLLNCAPAIMADLHRETGFVVILGRLFQNELLCLHQEGDPGSYDVHFARGRTVSMMVGATPRVILAYTPLSKLKNIYLSFGGDIAKSGLGNDWSEFRAKLRKIRKDGFYVSGAGEAAAGIIGIGAPIFDAAGDVIAGVTLAVPGDITADLGRLTTLIVKAGMAISARLAAKA